jgi:hypothetical protein
MDYTVIIRTMATADRADALRRAIASVFIGNTSTIQLVVVVNGPKFDSTLVAELESRTDLTLVQIEEASSPGAIVAGRRAVNAPCFSYLDDDDEYLPGAVDKRRAALAMHPEADMVACNGWLRQQGRDVVALTNLENVPQDPLQALFVENWLPSCGVGFRTATVPIAPFQDLPPHIHWSFLGYVLALRGKAVVVLNEPTFVINDTPGSASKLDTYLMCHVEVYERMLAERPPEPVRSIVARRLGGALHEVSDHFRRQGRRRDAWTAHIRSLRYTGGSKFLLYTRHLLRPAATRSTR